jgi:hypothetical protein
VMRSIQKHEIVPDSGPADRETDADSQLND